MTTPNDESKFGRLSAEMLVRKGNAEPSEIRRRRKELDDGSELLPPYGVFDDTINQTAPKKQHRIMLVLTEEEHETLGILAVKKGFTRHQVLRKALDAYFEWLTDEYGPNCRCVASTCSKDCDHLSAAEVCERPTDVE
ncbi:MAG: hypothetical protein ACREC6_02075 [Hyphomicrobiaceae bacterium]